MPVTEPSRSRSRVAFVALAPTLGVIAGMVAAAGIVGSDLETPCTLARGWLPWTAGWAFASAIVAGAWIAWSADSGRRTWPALAIATAPAMVAQLAVRGRLHGTPWQHGGLTVDELIAEVTTTAAGAAATLVQAEWLAGSLLVGLAAGSSALAGRRPATLATVGLGAWALVDASRAHQDASALRAIGRALDAASLDVAAPFFERATALGGVSVAIALALSASVAVAGATSIRRDGLRSIDKLGAVLFLGVAGLWVGALLGPRRALLDGVGEILRAPWSNAPDLDSLVLESGPRSPETTRAATGALRLTPAGWSIDGQGAVQGGDGDRLEAAARGMRASLETTERVLAERREVARRAERAAEETALRRFAPTRGDGEVSSFGRERPFGGVTEDGATTLTGVASWGPEAGPGQTLPVVLDRRLGAEELRGLVRAATSAGYRALALLSPLFRPSDVDTLAHALPLVASAFGRGELSVRLSLPGELGSRPLPPLVARAVLGAEPLTSLNAGPHIHLSLDDAEQFERGRFVIGLDERRVALAIGDAASAASFARDVERLLPLVAAPSIGLFANPAALRPASLPGAPPPTVAGDPSRTPYTRTSGAPGSRVRFGFIDVRGSVSSVLVRRVVRASSEQFMDCFRVVPERPAESRLRATIRFVVDPEGRVEMAAVDPGAPANAAFAACVVDVLHSLSFPAPESGYVEVSISAFVGPRQL